MSAASDQPIDISVRRKYKPASLVFHIGYHKTASTWMQSVFLADAGNNFRIIGERFEPRKDIVWPRAFEYDATAVTAKYRARIEHATEEGDVPVISDERFSGNPMSGGFDSKEIADRLKATFPDSRIVIVIREQKSMLYSTYDEYVREGGGNDIHRFLFPKSRYCMPPFRFEHFMYDKLIGYYMTLFSPENVLVLPFELFREFPAEFLGKFAAFSGATLGTMPKAAGRVNQSRPASILPIERRLNYFIKSDDLNGFSPLAFSRAHHLRRLLEKSGPWLPRSFARKVRAAIEDEIWTACEGRYLESNRHTETIADLDLNRFGYDC